MDYRYTANKRAHKLLGSLAVFLYDCSERKDFTTLGYLSQDIRNLLDSVEADCDLLGYNY